MTHLEMIQKMPAYELAELFGQIMDNCFNVGRCGECERIVPCMSAVMILRMITSKIG